MHDSLGTLLVVDDDQSGRELIALRLRRRGYKVELACNGRAALEQIAQKHFDLVLLDIVMPEMDGLQALKHLRRLKSRAQLPVIMATSKDETSDIVGALSEGANDYVTKPVDIEVLLARIGTHVILKRTAESLEVLNHRLEVANKQLRRNLDAASRIQRSQLPSRIPQFENYEFAWKYEPCEQLGGDNLNVMALSEHEVGFYVLDVSGHGVPAALLSVAINHLLKPSKDDTSVVSRPNRGRRSDEEPHYFVAPPLEVANRLNRHFVFDLSIAQFFTIIYGVLDLRDRSCHYVSTGHPPPIHLTADGEARVLESTGIPIGIFQEGEPGYAPFEEHHVQLKSGDRLYIYTDGIVEIRNSAHQDFGLDALKRVLQDGRQRTLDESLTDVFEAVHTWSDEAPTDDLSILALDVR